MDAAGPQLWQLFGRLHPLVLHLPIGLLLGVLVLEVLCARGKVSREAVAVLVWIAALSAVVSAAAGWALSHEEGYGGLVLERHERFGIAVALLALGAALAHAGSGVRLGVYRALLVAACVALVPAGHLGSQLTHGSDWLAGPRVAAPAGEERVVAGEADGGSEPDATAEPAAQPPPAPTYATLVAPILAARCTACHGETKHKGGLRLHTAEAIAQGAEDGPVIVAGDPAASLLVERIRLPLEHEDHMPPEGKPQPTAEEIATLTAWVAAGAPFEGFVELGLSAPGTNASPGAAAPAPASAVVEAPQIPPPDALALAALAAELVHVERVAADSNLISIDVAPVAPAIDDAALARLLEPLRSNVAELALARSAISDAALASVARCPELARLDLRATPVTDVGLAALSGHGRLERLVLAETKLTDAAVASLLELPALKSVALWRSGVSPEAIARLRAERPELVVNSGDEPAPEMLESEGELAFTSDRPVPGAESGSASLAPVNAACPVSGQPVKPEFAIVFQGRVVGFCCPNCPKEFWTEPARFESKLR